LVLAIWGEDPENQVPWPAPPFTSLWECELFFNAVDTMILRQPSPDDESSLEPLAFAWISCGTAIVDDHDPIPWTPENGKSVKQSWDKLRKRAKDLVALTWKGNKFLQKKAKRWLDSLALLTMPECGLPRNIVVAKKFKFVEEPSVKDYWDREHGRIQSKRAMRLKKFNQVEKVVRDSFYNQDDSRFGKELANKLKFSASA
jgi:hypothetical protein